MKIVARKLTPIRINELCEKVDLERDRRRAQGFLYRDLMFQARDQDILNMSGAATAAMNAIMMGAQPGDTRWRDPAKDFAWISTDNTIVPLDAYSMIELGQTAMGHVESLVFRARSIKDGIMAGEVPPDLAAEDLWT